MTISLKIPEILKSNAEFSLAVTNNGPGVVDVELTLAAGGKNVEFALDEAPKAEKQEVSVGPKTTEIYAIKDWGVHPVGTKVVMTGNGVDSNDAVIAEDQ